MVTLSTSEQKNNYIKFILWFEWKKSSALGVETHTCIFRCTLKSERANCIRWKPDSNLGFTVKLWRMQQFCFYFGFCRLWHFNRVIEWEGLAKGTAPNRIQNRRTFNAKEINESERAFVVIGIMSLSVECDANPKSKWRNKPKMWSKKIVWLWTEVSLMWGLPI